MTDEQIPSALHRRAGPSPALRARVLRSASAIDATPWWWPAAAAAAIVLFLNALIVPTNALDSPAKPELVAQAMELRRAMMEN
ncbi:MAG: hypothetical protein AAB263_02520 [Planctomycetota bacterium]